MAIDLWAAGCVIAEIFRNGKILFIASSNQDLLIQIFQIMGTPTKEEFQSLNPNFIQKQLNLLPNKFKNQLPSFVPEEAIDLLQNLLKYNPEERISAMESLSHPFFDELREIGIQGRLDDGKKLPDIFNFTKEEQRSVNQKLYQSILPKIHRNGQRKQRSTSRKK